MMRRHIFVGVVVWLVGLAGCVGHSTPGDGREATSLAGTPLWRVLPDPAKASRLDQDLAVAEQAWAGQQSEGAAIALGRAYAALGEYHEAIEAYTHGLAEHPGSYRLLRHRGHRYITVRELDKSARDYGRTWELVRDKSDAPESTDGSSTDKSAILYHWGLAEYLRGQYNRSDDVFSLRTSLPTLKDENVVSAAHWHYWALRRQGRNVEAARVVAPIREGMDVKENKSYYTLCRLYRGLITLDEVEKQLMDEQGKLNAGLAYGAACWRRFELKDDARAKALMEKIIATGNWPAFGFIAAEGDLARWDR